MYLSTGARRARNLIRLAAVVVWAAILLLPWWPTDFRNPTFVEFRPEPIESYRENGDDWWDVVPYGYYLWGYLAHLAAAAAMPVLVTRGWHWLGGIAVLLTTAWQFTAVVPYGLINTTVVPYLPLAAGVVTLLCWILIRTGDEDDVWKLFRGPDA